MITGSIVALVTPMHPDGAVDWDALKKLVEWHVAEGTNAIVAVGTTGESATLDVHEHLDVVKAVIATAAGRIPVIAGTGANSTSEAIELTEEARKLGADACLLVTPYYNKPTQEGLYQHHKRIAERVAVPQILYNVPGRTGVDMQNATVARLAGIPHIVGIKDATGNLERGAELIRLVGDRMAVYSGDDVTAHELILLGAKGNISVTANVAPRTMAAICAAALAGNGAEARRLNEPVSLLHRDLFIESSPIPVKWALQQMHLIESGIRLPLTELAGNCQETVRVALRHAGLLG
jgi:4-hydroxy-tetrahydrodipicolinate synthase